MKQLTIIIICAMLCISASVVSKNVFIPAKPKAFFIKKYTYGHQAIDECKNLHKNGWQQIRISPSDSGQGWSEVIVIAEKY